MQGLTHHLGGLSINSLQSTDREWTINYNTTLMKCAHLLEPTTAKVVRPSPYTLAYVSLRALSQHTKGLALQSPPNPQSCIAQMLAIAARYLLSQDVSLVSLTSSFLNSRMGAVHCVHNGRANVLKWGISCGWRWIKGAESRLKDHFRLS